jgi:pimeloyl-ACP methyl ester carboxylesterase
VRLAIVFAALLAAATVSLAADIEEPVDVQETAVSFDVFNTNNSKVPCQADGLHYEVQGHLVAPRALLSAPTPRAVVLWLHAALLPHRGLWALSVAGDDTYNLMHQMALRGHASVSFDFPGYGASPLPQGSAVCQGSYADIAHQVVQALRAGNYTTMEGPPVNFERVAIGGLSSGAWTSQAEAYSFHDVDGLIVMSWAEPDTGALSLDLLRVALGLYRHSTEISPFVLCGTGGEAKYGSDGPSGYVFTAGHDPRNGTDVLFSNADPNVIDAAMALGERDSCGERLSSPWVFLSNELNLASIDVPVALLYGEQDKFITWPLAASQRRHFTGSPEVTILHFPDTGHVIPLERTASSLLHPALDAWLDGHGF